LALHLLSRPVISGHEQGGFLMRSWMTSTIRVLTLVAVLVGVTACAKYPVVVNASAPAPTAATQAPTR
jgi:hypothetical protein